MKHLLVQRLEYRLQNPSEVYPDEVKKMAKVCLFHHPEKFMDGFEPTEWPEKKGKAPGL